MRTNQRVIKNLNHKSSLLNWAMLVAFTLVVLFYAGTALAQSPPTGPAGGDLAGTYPNPGLAVDRVRKTGDSMTGPLDIFQWNTGGLIYPFSLSTGGNAGPNRGLAFGFNLPASPGSALGAQMIAARESWGLSSYFSFSTHNGTAVAEALRIAGSGNVGIGTTIPTQKFHVVGKSLFQNTGTASLFIVDRTDGKIASLGAGGLSATFAYDESGAFKIESNSRSNISAGVFGTGATTRFTIDSAGNAGIGTNTPGYRFDVQGGQINASGGLCIAGDCKTAWSQVAGGGGSQWTTAGSAIHYGSGNVGIGTTGPGYGLTVVKTNGAGGNGWAALFQEGGKNGVVIGSRGSGNATGTISGVLGDLSNIANLSLNPFGGNVGIGIITPTYRLDVQGGAVNASGGLCIAGDCKTAWSQVGGGTGSQWTTAGTAIHYNAGNVGIGTTNPVFDANTAKYLTVTAGPGAIGSIGAAGGTGSNGTAVGQVAFVNSSLGTTEKRLATIVGSTDTATNSGNLDFYTAAAGAFSSSRMRITSGGNVGIGTVAPSAKLDVTGDVNVTGTITGGNIVAKYQDVAEWVPSRQKLAAGTVVVLDIDQSNQVTASTCAYDTKVAGVVSAQPGVLLGEAGENKLMVATTGRVKIKVDATRAPIKVGDLLVTSDVEGVAMKSKPLDLRGTPIHRPGTLIGKALEPLATGVGEILVLLSLQ